MKKLSSTWKKRLAFYLIWIVFNFILLCCGSIDEFDTRLWGFYDFLDIGYYSYWFDMDLYDWFDFIVYTIGPVIFYIIAKLIKDAINEDEEKEE